MTSSLADIPVADDELLARFILSLSLVRRSDNSARPEAFLPFKHTELSVTRHRDLEEHELWSLGKVVADQRSKPLIGRADILARLPRLHELDVEASEGPGKGGRNHANIIGWPSEKSAQMIRAVELADEAKYVAAPLP